MICVQDKPGNPCYRCRAQQAASDEATAANTQWDTGDPMIHTTMGLVSYWRPTDMAGMHVVETSDGEMHYVSRENLHTA